MPWRRALLCSAVALLAACNDGYPSEDGALVLTYGMSREATLKAMNTIGHHGYLEHNWLYEVDEGCQLRVQSDALDNEETVLAVTSPGLAARVVITSDGEEGRSHQVFVHKPGVPAQPGSLVLSGASEFDAGQMKWLVEYLGTSCRPRAAPR